MVMIQQPVCGEAMYIEYTHRYTQAICKQQGSEIEKRSRKSMVMIMQPVCGEAM